MNGDRLKRAREIRGLTQAEIAEAVGVSQAAIARIEQDLLEPSEQLTQQIALKTSFPVSFFHQETGPDFPLGSLLYRKHTTLKSKDRAQILQTAWAAYVLYDYMSQQLRMMPVRLPKIENEDAVMAAQMMRNALGIEPDVPIRHLINKLEKAGVIVLSIPLEIHEHDAFSLWVENKRPVIVLTGGKPGDRQRRSVSREAAHLVLHYAPTGSRDDMEDEADLLASEFLLPEEVIRKEIKTPVTLSDLADLKPRWGVSIQSLIERAFELKIISTNQRKYLWQQLSRQGWRQNEPIPIEPEKPRALQKMAEVLYAEKNGRANYQQLARETSMPVGLVLQIIEGYAGSNIEQEVDTSQN